MPLLISSLNSGSNGNCYYIGNGRDAIFIDAGISCREIERRMKRLELSIRKVKAIFITHEHADHIFGLKRLVQRFEIPVYTTPLTASQFGFTLPPNLVRHFETGTPVRIGELTITPGRSPHDAVDMHHFTVEGEGKTVGVFTDIGAPHDGLINDFRRCHAAFLESNYDPQMLEEGSYAPHLKDRIRSGRGHLSNLQALQLFMQHRPAIMSHLILSHLSFNNNSPSLVKDLFQRVAGPTYIHVASRRRESEVFVLQGKPGHSTPASGNQLGLFSV